MYDILNLGSEWGDTLKILKYKKCSNGQYKVELDNGVVLHLYEEAILKYQLLLLKEIDDDLMIQIDQYNQECDVYYVALKKLKSRFLSVDDLKKFLIRKEYPMNYVEKSIDKLLKQGYLNDRVYARSYIHDQMITTSKGPYRLEKELLDKKIDSSIIQEEILSFSEEEQVERIHKIIERGIKSNHTRGGLILKQKIFQDLKGLGYDVSMISRELSHYSFSVDSLIAEREYQKLYRKYSRKYQGEKLDLKIREKLFQKGLRYPSES